MNLNSRSAAARFLTAGFAAVIIAARVVAGSSGVGGTDVQYSPLSHGANLTVPSSDTYTLTIAPPASYTGPYPTNVQLQVVADIDPLNNLAAALSYIQLSATNLTFNSNAPQAVTVTMTFPSSAVTLLVPSPTYTYHIYATGWAGSWGNPGSAISAGLSSPVVINPSTANPPLVSIVTPEDFGTFSFAPNAFPASIPFQYTASTDTISPVITSYSASLVAPDGSTTPVTITADGLGTANITGNGTLVIPGPGQYSVSVSVANSVGPNGDTNTFTVTTTTVPPTVAISSPTLGASFTYRAGSAPTAVTHTFTGHSNYAVRTLTATLDGQDVTNLYTPTGIGTTDASGSFAIGYTTGGPHSLTVTTTDDYGTASTSTNYVVNYVAPTPALSITTPTEGQVFTITYPATAMNVPFGFVTTSNNGFVVDSVSATLNGSPVSVSTSGLTTALATSSGTFLNLVPGSYTFTANGTSAGIPVSQTVHFVVQMGQLPPPTVVINTPAPNATFSRYSTGPALTIPMTFTGTSNLTNGVITGVTASLDGVPLVFTPVVGTKVVLNSANMVVSSAGTHTIKVTATDAAGTATATQTFTVTILQAPSVSGTVYFDSNTNNVLDGVEPGLPGVTVTLKSSTGAVLGTTTTSSSGAYTFNAVLPGNYTVTATQPAGVLPTAGNSRSVTVSGPTNVSGVNIGYMIDFCGLQGMTAGGFTIGYWKNNADKAIAGKTSGIQVSAATMNLLTAQMGTLAIPSVYSKITLKQASAIMGSTSSAPVDLLSKQLVASEYNYLNGAYLNGNATLTYLFIYWGESIVANPSAYSSTYIIWAQNWFNAYNNTHGGAICGPALLGTSCTGSTGCGTGCN